jgi:hypothetical protein
MKLKRRFLLFIVYLAFLSCLLPAAIYIYKNPAYNFDMLGYMALVIRMDQPHTLEEIHTITYSSARQIVPPGEYEKLTEALPYRKKFAADPLEFKKVLPNYIVKPLYTWLCWLFYKTGFSLPIATVMPSIVSFLIIGLFLFYWIRKYLRDVIAFPAAALIMYSIFTTAVARLSTPDCLSALFLFLSVYFILEKRNLTLMTIFLLLSIFSRVDNIITCFFIISFLTFSKKWKRIEKRQYFFMLAVLVIAYLTIILPARQFGWSIFYYTQYAKHIDYSRDFDQPITLFSYLSLIYSKLVTAFVSTHFTFFSFLGLLILSNPGLSFRKLSFDQTFLLLLASIGITRFLLLPDLSDRFYFGFYLVIIILLVRKLSSQNLMLANEDR